MCVRKSVIIFLDFTSGPVIFLDFTRGLYQKQNIFQNWKITGSEVGLLCAHQWKN